MNKIQLQKKSTRMQLLLPAAAMGALLFLTACDKGSILEYRNAQIVNGQIYAGNANTPFSGQLTNVPGHVVLGTQSPLQQLHPGFLQFRDVLRNVGLEVPVPALTLCNAQISGGLLDGNVVCNAQQSDIPVLQMAFKKGVLEGKLEYDNPKNKNQVISTVVFKAGQLDGKQEIFSPKTQKLVHVMPWKNGILEGEEVGFYDDSGKQALHATLVNGKYDGEFIKYAPDGERVIYKANFIQNLKDGAEDQFNPDTGKPIGHGQWSNGKAQGVFRQWDVSGNLISEKTYDNDVEVTSTSNGQISQVVANIDSCVDAWLAVFRKARGEDAMVRNDQLGEWQDWCKAGKHPG